MSNSMLLGAFDWLSDFFKALVDFIPKIMYLLYSSLACLLDVIQLLFRKLAGLDVYYVDGKAVTGDIVYNFITGILGINNNSGVDYPVLNTVFWAFIVFGLIMVFMTTIVAIIKSHYSYDDKAAKGPMQYVYTAGKAVINMVAVPVIVVLGLYLSQAILTAIDSITSTSSSSVEALYGDQKDLLMSTKDAKGNDTYVYYDFFGVGATIHYGTSEDTSLVLDRTEIARTAASNQTFSGSLFRVAAFNGNRARLGQMIVSSGSEADSRYAGEFTGGANSEMTLFANAETQEELAQMIDTAFACHLHLNKTYSVEYDFVEGGIASDKYFTNFYTKSMASFSKFNVGLVWYYYDLWNFNFIIAFAALGVCVTVFVNIIFGLISRLFLCVSLFLIAPPLFGLAPLDGGEAGKKWRTNFIKQVLMTYGAVGGMNLMFLILPYINSINFFNISIADLLVQTLIIIAGLITVKALIALISDLIGAADANKEGEGLAKETGKAAYAGVKMTAGAAKMAATSPIALTRLGVGAYQLGAAGVDAVRSTKNRIQSNSADKKLKKSEDVAKQEKLITQWTDKRNWSSLDKSKAIQDAKDAGLSGKQAKQMWKRVDEAKKAESRGVFTAEGTRDFMGRTAHVQRADFLRAGMEQHDKTFKNERAKYAGMTNLEKGRARSAEQNLLKGQRDSHLSLSRSLWSRSATNAGRAKKNVLTGEFTVGQTGLKVGEMYKDTYTKNAAFETYNDELKKKKEKAEKKDAQKAEQDYRNAVIDRLDSINRGGGGGTP